MIVLNATWENRNLGLETTEITIEPRDAAEEVERLLAALNTEYAVIKAPTPRTDVGFLLSRHGYSYVESMLRLCHRPSLLSAPPEKAGLLDRITISPMERREIEDMLAHVRQGLFHTDRISLDPYFSLSLANRRYAYWIQDEAAAGTVFWKFNLDGEAFGFVGAKPASDSVCHIVLNGIYPEFRGRGLAYFLTHKIEAEYHNKGAALFTTDVSTNNLASFKGFLQNGYTIEKITNIFVKHNLAKEAYADRVRDLFGSDRAV